MINKIKSIVPPRLDGQRFDLACVDLFPGHSRKFIKKVIDSGGAYLNKKRILISKKKVIQKDTIELFWDSAEPVQNTGLLTHKNIIFMNEDYIILNKPPGIASQETLTSHENTVISALISLNSQEFTKNNLHLVHRLDKDTSGIMIVARNISFKKNLENQFKNKQINKIYEALCFGTITKNKFDVDFPIHKHHMERNYYFCNPNNKMINTSSRSAFTKFELIKIYKSFKVSHLKCFPLTGRTHQIRVHLSAYGFPILGDKKYSNNVIGHKAIGLAVRQMLHASSIEFADTHGMKVKYSCPLPSDFIACIDVLSKN